MRMQKVFSAVSSPTPQGQHRGVRLLYRSKSFRRTSANRVGGVASAALASEYMKKLLFIVLSIVAAGLSCGRDSSASTINSAAFTGACRKLPSPSAPEFTNRFNQFVMNLCYQKQNWKHDANRRTSQNIHDTLVKIWYSPLLFKWMTVQNRQGPVPDGAIAIKEEYCESDFPHPVLERDGQGFKPLVGRMVLVGRWDRNHRQRGRAFRDEWMRRTAVSV